VTWPLMREAQATALHLPNVHMVVTIDIGDPLQLHPPNKQEAGRRAALVALAHVYGQQLEASGPTVANVSRDGATLRVSFDHADNLHFVGDPSRVFEVAGEDGRYVPARAQIDHDGVLVSAESVSQPVAVRCEWRNFPTAFLLNGSNLPVAPFELQNADGRWRAAPREAN